MVFTGPQYLTSSSHLPDLILSSSFHQIDKDQTTTFEEHVELHRLWKYLFYIHSLSVKEETDFTGIEYIISGKLKDNDISWVPNNTHLND